VRGSTASVSPVCVRVRVCACACACACVCVCACVLPWVRGICEVYLPTSWHISTFQSNQMNTQTSRCNNITHVLHLKPSLLYKGCNLAKQPFLHPTSNCLCTYAQTSRHKVATPTNIHSYQARQRVSNSWQESLPLGAYPLSLSDSVPSGAQVKV